MSQKLQHDTLHNQDECVALSGCTKTVTQSSWGLRKGGKVKLGSLSRGGTSMPLLLSRGRQRSLVYSVVKECCGNAISNSKVPIHRIPMILGQTAR